MHNFCIEVCIMTNKTPPLDCIMTNKTPPLDCIMTNKTPPLDLYYDQ